MRGGLFGAGGLSLILGLPGVGKSMLALQLAARVCRGLPLPGRIYAGQLRGISEKPRPPADAWILSREDNDHTIRARLAVALNGQPANMDRIQIRQGAIFPSHWEPNQPLLHHLLLDAPCVQLVILDPLPAFLHQADASYSAPIAAALRPLLDLARSRNILLLGVIHPPKCNPSRVCGSHAYMDLARSAVLLTRDPQQHGRRLLLPIKSPCAVAGSYAFTIQGAGEAAHVAWEHPPRHAQTQPRSEIRSEPRPSGSDPHAQFAITLPPVAVRPMPVLRVERARTYLRQALAKGPLPSHQLFTNARRIGLPERTLRRALAAEHLHPRKSGRTWVLSPQW